MTNKTAEIYYFETDMGCTLVKANSPDEARAEVAADVGSRNIKGHRIATKEDIAWIGAMGGHVSKLSS